jgi:hypothetical protein
MYQSKYMYYTMQSHYYFFLYLFFQTFLSSMSGTTNNIMIDSNTYATLPYHLLDILFDGII